ncbi:unnamed protein product [Mytilus coruscus]|uniref:Uncharacterized protein n=1 Tax=Mytilus coruscus TaxID=42192 RepID=A0A6J8E317_MYTCO|nr:unnamed protein product [Mytilus coruscus]
MWRIYLDSQVDRMLLLTEGITLRNKSVPLHSQNPYYQKNEYITTTVRVKNIPLSADDGQTDRELRQRNIEIFTINRERLRVDNLVTNCWTGDRVVICKKFDKPLPRFLTIERDEQQETTTANVDENTDTEERQQIQALTENDKKDDTDEQPELTDGDDEDNLTHSISLNK